MNRIICRELIDSSHSSESCVRIRHEMPAHKEFMGDHEALLDADFQDTGSSIPGQRSDFYLSDESRNLDSRDDESSPFKGACTKSQPQRGFLKRVLGRKKTRHSSENLDTAHHSRELHLLESMLPKGKVDLIHTTFDMEDEDDASLVVQDHTTRRVLPGDAKEERNSKAENESPSLGISPPRKLTKLEAFFQKFEESAFGSSNDSSSVWDFSSEGSQLRSVEQDEGSQLRSVEEDEGSQLRSVAQDTAINMSSDSSSIFDFSSESSQKRSVEQDEGSPLRSVEHDEGSQLRSVEQDITTSVTQVSDDDDAIQVSRIPPTSSEQHDLRVSFGNLRVREYATTRVTRVSNDDAIEVSRISPTSSEQQDLRVSFGNVHVREYERTATATEDDPAASTDWPVGIGKYQDFITMSLEEYELNRSPKNQPDAFLIHGNERGGIMRNEWGTRPTLIQRDVTQQRETKQLRIQCNQRTCGEKCHTKTRWLVMCIHRNKREEQRGLFEI